MRNITYRISLIDSTFQAKFVAAFVYCAYYPLLAAFIKVWSYLTTLDCTHFKIHLYDKVTVKAASRKIAAPKKKAASTFWLLV